MLDIGYRQLVVLLLGTAITLTSLGFVYNWHNQFSAYQEQVKAPYDNTLTMAAPAEGATEAHMALTYCAKQLLKENARVFDDAADNNGQTASNVDVLTFYNSTQAIDIKQLLTNDVTRRARYRLRRHNARQFEIEVTYD